MIAHVILYKPRTDISDETKLSILQGLGAAAATIPTIRKLQVGKRVKHGRPGYEQAMREDYEYAVIIEFEDIDGLTAYLSHPAHGSIGKHFSESASSSLAYDYEMLELGTGS